VVPKAPASTPQPPVLAGTRVLVLEDDHEVATLLETALGARGADVTVTKSEKELGEATKPATHGGFDAALIDLSPLADRVEVTLERLRRTFPEMTMVVISGSVGGEGLPSGEASQLRWVRKPFEIPELVAALLDARAEKKNA
jgi:CheY-like chemotaxis protein